MKRTIIDPTSLELSEKTVAIKRVTKVVKGGRHMRFTALVVVGDANGHVGVGLGKATEVPEAIRKGKEDACKNLIEITLDDNKSITHDFIGKFGGANVLLKRAPEGTGIIAGGPALIVCFYGVVTSINHNGHVGSIYYFISIFPTQIIIYVRQSKKIKWIDSSKIHITI